MMDARWLRPLGVGEIVDAALKIYRARFATMLKAVAVVVIPVQLLNVIVLISLPSNGTSTTTTSNGFSTTSTSSGTSAAVLGAFVLVQIVTVLSGLLATAACLKVVSDAYLGTVTTWRESLKFGLSKFHSLLWVGVLSTFGFIFGLFFCFVPGIWLYVAWAVAVPGAADRGREGDQGTRSIVQAGAQPVVAHVRRAAHRGADHRGRDVRVDDLHHPAPAERGQLHDHPGRQRDRPLHLGGAHDSVLRGSDRAHLLRAARPQGRLRPRADGAADRRAASAGWLRAGTVGRCAPAVGRSASEPAVGCTTTGGRVERDARRMVTAPARRVGAAASGSMGTSTGPARGATAGATRSVDSSADRTVGSHRTGAVTAIAGRALGGTGTTSSCDATSDAAGLLRDRTARTAGSAVVLTVGLDPTGPRSPG